MKGTARVLQLIPGTCEANGSITAALAIGRRNAGGPTCIVNTESVTGGRAAGVDVLHSS